MLELVWGILNIIIFISFVIICFKATKIIREKIGLLASIIFVFGLLSFTVIEKKAHKEVFDLNSQKAKSKNLNYNTVIQTVHLEKKLVTSTLLDIKFAEKDSKLNPLNGEIFRGGFISGTTWKTNSIIIQKNQNNDEYQYFVSGVIEWKLLNFKIFSEHKNFRGILPKEK